MKYFAMMFLAAHILTSVDVLGQRNQLVDRVKELEEKVKLLEDYNDRVLQQQFETQKNELSTSIRRDLSEAKDEVEDELRVFQITGGVLTFIVGAGVIAFFFYYIKKIPKVAELLLTKKLKSHLDENTTQMLELLTSHSTENKIRTTKKIFVVAGSDEELNKTLKLFKDMKFAKVEGGVFRFYQSLPLSDLVVFSSQDRSLPEELIKEFLSQGNADDSFVYFGPGRLTFDPSASYSEQINFANSKYTLYNQAFNVLAFNHLIGNF